MSESLRRSMKLRTAQKGPNLEISPEVGPGAALKDAYHRPKEPSITEEARAWVVSLACVKPKDLGYAAEMWTRSALAKLLPGRLAFTKTVRRSLRND